VVGAGSTVRLPSGITLSDAMKQPAPASPSDALPGAKPFAPACERNRDPILAVLRAHLGEARSVLEIGSGTGQHAVHFAQHLPHLSWQCADRPDYLPGIRAWLAEAALPNTPEPIALDVQSGPWPTQRFDAVFSANTVHYMPWSATQAWLAQLGQVLQPGARLVIYGPFNEGGRFTSASNAEFDAWLKTLDPAFGLRDEAEVDALAAAQGWRLRAALAMPANNRCLVWSLDADTASAG
jgi:cyclopropane fatty-acyl-phospholipid synthase-like methyltransferase